MKRIYSLALLACLVLMGCNSEPTLQKYFVEHTENKDFIVLDLSPSILNFDKAKLSTEQNAALQSFNKMNVLAFKLNGANQAQFDAERTKVVSILKDEKYQQLMKFGSGKQGAAISFVGDDEHIEEFVLFGNYKETGFVIVRVLGKDMNPNGIMTILSALKNANVDLKQLKLLQQMFQK